MGWPWWAQGWKGLWAHAVPFRNLWSLELALWYSQLSLWEASFSWSRSPGVSVMTAWLFPREGQQMDTMTHVLKNSMNIRLFLSPSTVFLIKNPIQLITFCHFSHMSMNKLTNGCVKILYILESDAALVSFTCCGRARVMWETRSAGGLSVAVHMQELLGSRVTVFILISLPAGFVSSLWQPSAPLSEQAWVLISAH